MRDRICIILLHTGQLEETLGTLTSLSKIEYKLFTPLVVVQPSTRESIAALRAAFPRVPLFENKENLGIAAGNNTAIAWALKKKFKWILLLNNPAQVPSDLLKKLMAIAQEEPLAQLFKTPNHAALFIHRGVFETIGLFDPRFFLFWDKTDFLCRARRMGFPCKTIAIENLQNASIASFPKHSPTRHYHWWRGYLLWAKRNHPSAIAKPMMQSKVLKLFQTYLSLLLSNRKTRLKLRPVLQAGIKGVLHYFIYR